MTSAIESPIAPYQQVCERLQREPRTWLITGVAGFIGSNLLQGLLALGQRVVGLDNFATGFQHNLEAVRQEVTPSQWANFRFHSGNISLLADCQAAMRFDTQPVDYVLHHAALGTVPGSIEDPTRTNQINIDGTLNMLVAARDAAVRRFIYATSSSVYGDDPRLPKVEDSIGRPLSPYALTKHVNELYAGVFSRLYGIATVGLRYFNVFGPRQDPNGAYAAVIPTWIACMIRGVPVYINGDGETTRDFCHVDDVRQANLLAAATDNPDACDQVYNIGGGERTTLNQLHAYLHRHLRTALPELRDSEPVYRAFRSGDIRHSVADIGKAHALLGYRPAHRVENGLARAMDWYVRDAAAQRPTR